MDTSNVLGLVPLAASLAVFATVHGAHAASRVLRRKADEVGRAPRVSILKPVAGVDEDLAQNLASFAALDYPAFELLLGLADPSDPAAFVVKAFVDAHPGLDVRIVHTDPAAAVNPKVAQLLGLERVATGEVLVISDANVRVAPSYLWSLVAELSRPGVGLVSSLVAGDGERTWGAALENLQLGAQVAPTVAAMTLLSDLPVAVGKSMAMWRRALVSLGGFAVVGDVLAEDHVLGRLFADAGHLVAVDFAAVENRNADCTLARTLERHTRWAKMRRAIVPVAFAVEPLGSPFVVAVASLLWLPSPLAVQAIVLVALLQTAVAAASVQALRGRPMALRHVVLEPLRALLLQLCWLRACVSRRVEWRGHPFLVQADSRLVPWPSGRVRASALAP